MESNGEIQAKMNGEIKVRKIGVRENEKLLRKEYLKKRLASADKMNKKQVWLLFMKNKK